MIMNGFWKPLRWDIGPRTNGRPTFGLTVLLLAFALLANQSCGNDATTMHFNESSFYITLLQNETEDFYNFTTASGLNITDENNATVIITEHSTTPRGTEPTTAQNTTEPITTQNTTVPITTQNTTEPITTQNTTKPITTQNTMAPNTTNNTTVAPTTQYLDSTHSISGTTVTIKDESTVIENTMTTPPEVAKSTTPVLNSENALSGGEIAAIVICSIIAAVVIAFSAYIIIKYRGKPVEYEQFDMISQDSY